MIALGIIVLIAVIVLVFWIRRRPVKINRIYYKGDGQW